MRILLLKELLLLVLTNYFFNSMANIKNLDKNLLGTNQITFANTGSVIYYIKYFKNLDSINSLHLVFNDVDAYFECID